MSNDPAEKNKDLSGVPGPSRNQVSGQSENQSQQPAEQQRSEHQDHEHDHEQGLPRDTAVVDPQLEAPKQSKPEGSSRNSVSLNNILTHEGREVSPEGSAASTTANSSTAGASTGSAAAATGSAGASTGTTDDKTDLANQAPAKANFDNVEGGNSAGSASSNGGSTSGISLAISDNIDTNSLPDDSSLMDESLIKSNPRTKLGIQDIRIILYLIITIKPFKYIGDRTLSQTKKWELIQSEFSKYKHLKNHPNTIIPTIRTLQRQLSSAIKKAKQRRKSVLGANDHETPLFKTITLEHSLDDLELASLELFELSETLKNGKLANSSLLEYSLILNNEIDDNDKKMSRNLFSTEGDKRSVSHSDQSINGGDQSRPTSTSTAGSTTQTQPQLTSTQLHSHPLVAAASAVAAAGTPPPGVAGSFLHPSHPHYQQGLPPPPLQYGYAAASYPQLNPGASPIPNSVQPLHSAMYSMQHHHPQHHHPQHPIPLAYPPHTYPGNVPGPNVPGPGLGSVDSHVKTEVLNELNDTRQSIKQLLNDPESIKNGQSQSPPKPQASSDKKSDATKDGDKGHDIVGLLENLIHKSNQLQQENHGELVRLIDRNNQLIELNKRFQVEQNNINKSLISDVLTYLNDHPSVPKDTVNSIRQLI